MRITTAVAPSLAELNAIDTGHVPYFPIYPDIAGVLAGPDPDPDDDRDFGWSAKGHVLATAAAYAYSDVDAMSQVMARLGMEGNHCVEIVEENDAMLITSCAFLVQSADGSTVVLAYRGTRPTGLVDLFGDLDTGTIRVRAPHPDPARPTDPRLAELAATEVHTGFYRNTRATRAEVMTRLVRAVEQNLPVDADPGADDTDVAITPLPSPMTSLYITGHSLGGAMAVLTAVLLSAEELAHDDRRTAVARTLRAVHTFGQPMVGTPEFAEVAGGLPWPGEDAIGSPATLDGRIVRWVHRDDVVPSIPVRSWGTFRHIGREFRFRRPRCGIGELGWRSDREGTGQLWSTAPLLLSPLSLVAKMFAITRNLWFLPSIDDHLPERYVDELRPPRVSTEFGD